MIMKKKVQMIDPHCIAGLSIVLALAMSAGCAVQTDVSKTFRVEFDPAIASGQDVEQFILPDGSKGTIRVVRDRYSVKLDKQARVVEFDENAVVHFKSAQVVAGYELVVLEKSTPGCDVKTQLVAVKGAETRSWDFGNCRTKPIITIDSQSATFDLRDGALTTRYQFTDGRLVSRSRRSVS